MHGGITSTFSLAVGCPASGFCWCHSPRNFITILIHSMFSMVIDLLLAHSIVQMVSCLPFFA
jgi:hypothetical protein